MKFSKEIPGKTFTIPTFTVSWLHLVLVIVCFLWFRQCQKSRSLASEITSINSVKNDTIQYYKTKEGEWAASKLSYQGEKASLEAFLTAARDSSKQFERLASYYRNIKAGVKTETKTVIDSIEVPYIVEGTPFTIPFSKQEQYYSLTGRSTNNGLYLDNISIPNSQSIVIGKKKIGFFKSELRVDVVNSNPYIKTTKLDSYVQQERIKRVAIGPYVGVGIGVNGIQPQIGVGVSFGVIRF